MFELLIVPWKRRLHLSKPLTGNQSEARLLTDVANCLNLLATPIDLAATFLKTSYELLRKTAV
jgi:hypothetical protein